MRYWIGLRGNGQDDYKSNIYIDGNGYIYGIYDIYLNFGTNQNWLVGCLIEDDWEINSDWWNRL